MNAKSLFKYENADLTIHETGGILPQEAGVRSSIVTPVSDQRPMAATDDTDTDLRQCRYCTEPLPPGAVECPLCLRAVRSDAADTHPAIQPSRAPAPRPLPAAVPSPVDAPDSGAVYTLESPAKCPACDAELTTFHVIRVLRTQVSFTSTLPRKAYVIACPECRRLLSAGLSGVF